MNISHYFFTILLVWPIRIFVWFLESLLRVCIDMFAFFAPLHTRNCEICQDTIHKYVESCHEYNDEKCGLTRRGKK